MPAVDEVKANRKNLIGERRKVMEIMKRLSELVDLSRVYAPYAEVYSTYSKSNGFKKNLYYRKNKEALDNAISLRETMEKLSGEKKYLPKTWRKQFDEAGRKKQVLDREIKELDRRLSGYKELLYDLGMTREAANAETSIMGQLKIYEQASRDIAGQKTHINEERDDSQKSTEQQLEKRIRKPAHEDR